ncbi:MAG: class I SAM-dependent methyltransferase [Eubacteriales bacterium]
MPDNTKRFSQKADGYKKYRPSYPSELMDYLYSQLGFSPKSTVADIGSGTGIFSACLLERGSRVYAVEPNTPMRKAAQDWLSAYPTFVSMDGTAEDTTLPDHCADFVTAAQAFHWFDRERFRDECARILVPRGKVVLVWNTRDEQSAVTAECREVCRRMCPDFKAFHGGTEVSLQANESFFKRGTYEVKSFANNVSHGRQDFIGRNLSSSYAPKPEDASYVSFTQMIGDIFDRHAVDGKVVQPYVTECYSGEVE